MGGQRGSDDSLAFERLAGMHNHLIINQDHIPPLPLVGHRQVVHYLRIHVRVGRYVSINEWMDGLMDRLCYVSIYLYISIHISIHSVNA